jgi:ABC-type lipoprotein release transport system permease subunit
MNWQLAWRNIWRNPRRTTVILLAVIIGVWSMVFLGALNRGTIEGMVRNAIATLTGHLQIHQNGYREDPAIENSIDTPEKVETAIRSLLPPGARWTARIRVNAVASNARHYSGVTLVGIDPKSEAEVSFIGSAVSQGRYLKPDDDNAILVGAAFLEKFDTRLGRKLVLMSQDDQKNIASRAFRIVGVFDAEMDSTEKQFVFVHRTAARKMLKLEKGVSEFAVFLKDEDQLGKLQSQLQAALPSDQYDVSSWRELLPIMTALLRIMDSFIYIWTLVTFVAMGFGIVNTTLMAVFERMREFGILKALGMRPWRIIRGVLTESLILLLLGMTGGNLLAVISTWPLSRTGIDLSALAAGAEYAGMTRIIYPLIDPRDVIIANVIVLLLGLLVSLYPALKAARFKPVEAMVHV